MIIDSNRSSISMRFYSTMCFGGKLHPSQFCFDSSSVSLESWLQIRNFFTSTRLGNPFHSFPYYQVAMSNNPYFQSVLILKLQGSWRLTLRRNSLPSSRITYMHQVWHRPVPSASVIPRLDFHLWRPHSSCGNRSTSRVSI